MTWFRVDDKMHSHRKPARAGLEAMGLWVMLGSWCGDNNSDGKVSSEVVKRYSEGRDEVVERLVASGLLKRLDDGFELHDFLKWNPSAKETDAIRKARSKAGKKGAATVNNGAGKRPANMPASAEANAQQNLSKEVDRPPAKGSGSGDGSGSGLEGDARGSEFPDVPTAVLAELRRHRCFGPLANDDSAQALAMVAFNHSRSATAAVQCIAEAAAKEGPRAAAAGPQDVGSLAKFVGGCIRTGPTSRTVRSGRDADGLKRDAKGQPMQTGGESKFVPKGAM